jgi:translation initiation factor IF-2
LNEIFSDDSSALSCYPIKGPLSTFRHHKKDIQEASKGLECGMAFGSFKDFEIGDQIQSYYVDMTDQKLE